MKAADPVWEKLGAPRTLLLLSDVRAGFEPCRGVGILGTPSFSPQRSWASSPFRRFAVSSYTPLAPIPDQVYAWHSLSFHERRS